MPDLSKRPERYATALLALTVVGLSMYFGLGVRVTTASSEQERAAPSTLTRTVTVSAGGGGANCSEFPTQEAAQIFWNKHRKQYATWDGNRNGVVCEQLKSMAQLAALRRTATATATPTATASANQPAGTADTTPARHPAGSTTTVSVPTPGKTITEPAAPPSEVVSPPANKPTAPSKATILATRQMFGMYAETNDEYMGLESSLARQTQIHGYFQGWDTGFRAASVNAAWAAGQVPLLTWESRSLNPTPSSPNYSLTDIAAGDYDAYLRTYAAAITANGLPLIVRFDQEMNGTWYRWAEANPSYDNPIGSYIAAWRHVHDIFAAAGANKYVIWDWSPNRTDNIGHLPSIDNYYPGDSYVDLLGMTGYVRTGDRNATFDGAYTTTLNQLRALAPGKPLLLSEVGATENGGNKTAFINSFFAGLPNNPDVIGFVWFDYTVTSQGTTDDWRINSSTASLNAFRAGLYASDYGLPTGKKPVWGTASANPAPSSSPSPSPSRTP